MMQGVVFQPEQARFLAIPQAPLCYWLRPRFLQLLATSKSLEASVAISEGAGTRNESRFVRFVWEPPQYELLSRWLSYAKGGGFKKWIGFEYWVVDWEDNGAHVRSYIADKFPYLRGNVGILIRDEQYYGTEGLSYTDVARGSLSVRFIDHGICSDQGPGIYPKYDSRETVAAILHARLHSFLLRALTPNPLHFRKGYLYVLPLPHAVPPQLEGLGRICVELKRALVVFQPIERAFTMSTIEGSNSLEPRETDAVAALLHALEGYSERLVFDAYGLDADDTAAVLAETGTPAGWYPLVAGYDALPELPEALAGELDLPEGFTEYLAQHERRTLDAAELDALKARLRAFYEAGPGATVESEEDEASDDKDDDDNGSAAGAYIPIPTETFIEELSQKLEIHPISVYRLLEELRRDEGIVCKPELKRHVEDFFSVTILRMLGHRWPEQDRYEQEQGHPMIDPKWVDEDGIIPLAPCAGERSLIERLRCYLDEKFGPENGPNVETEAGQILGVSLERWVEREFFKRHVKQFKKRPIAWHFKSERGAFQAIAYYHEFDNDRLHALRAKYVKDALQDLRRRLAEERKKSEGSRTAVKLEEQIAEVEAFDQKLRRLLEGNERDYRIWVPWKEADQQPRGWRPDINDGVRVNIAPVQRAGLLAASVLSAKDLKSLRAPAEGGSG